MSSSLNVDSKGKDKGPTQLLDGTALTAEAKYPLNFTKSNERFVLGLHYNGNDSFLFVNATKIIQGKRFRYEKVSIVFRLCFKRFYNQ